MDKESQRELDTLIKEYDSFVKESLASQLGLRNKYLRSDNGSIYVRKLLHPTLPHCFCISSIELSEHMRGKGIMTGFLDYVESNLSEYAGVEFECIHNHDLVDYLEKRGYTWSPYRAEYLKDLEYHLYKAKA
ncbi:hypothetical protein [Vibrio sp. Vb0587]|uniref:hypothetical protein n=1 Tax=Vibrio sp. Vb0587 TaxID=3074626 RepID=UPI00296501A2|nr:hypothetical protein [Vibrio sp. Vb0587]MDW1965775.1 hypothetical protein [Vibrio sp. Vb0587]